MAVSLIGSWMQMMVEGWLVYDLTGSRHALGQIRFYHTLPVTLLSFAGGIVADHFSRKKILLTTQSISMVSALLLAWLAYSGSIQFWHIGLISLLLGTAHSFDIPARQSLMAGLVGSKDLPNAIALNTSLFNGARCIGPALGGILLGLVGVVGCFLGNALSYLAVIGSYLLIRFPETPRKEGTRKKGPIREALDYLETRRPIRITLIMVACVSLFAWPYSVLLPAFAKDRLGLSAEGLGLLMAANGLGAFLGAISMVLLADYSKKANLIAIGGFGLMGSLALFTATRTLMPALVMLFLAGWFMILFFSSCNLVVQINSPDPLRGRLMSFYSFAFIGLTPFGSLLAGWAADRISIQSTLLVGQGICAATFLFTLPALIRSIRQDPIHPEEEAA